MRSWRKALVSRSLLNSGFLRASEKFKSVPDLEKYGKKKAEYGTICALADFCPHLIEN